MEIVLKAGQKQILKSIKEQKKALELEFGKLIQRENEILVSIIEAVGAQVVPGIEVTEDTIVIPGPSPAEKAVEEAVKEIAQPKKSKK